MFNSKKNNYSHSSDNTTLSTANDIFNGAPKITSTPLIPRHGDLSRRSSVLLSPTKAKLSTPRRYSLSEINSPVNKSNLRMQEAHSPGPLLASLSFKDNVSMYEETKSSGLARRIVLYNEEAEHERQPTHQEKYHSPGLFPIVHLFKKKPPFLEQLPKRVKIKLSSPDYLKSHIPQHRNKLLEGLGRPKFQNQHSLSSCSQTSHETKSVLDALKEISRKRIHSSEDYDLHEDSGKRLRTELYNGTTTTSKRNRADSPILDSSESPPSKQTQKKFCVYDEFAASKSSTDFSFLDKMEPATSKRKTISTSTESLKEIKHVKLINAETQTILSSTDKKNSIESGIDECDSQKMKKESPLKVFDDAPLDRIRKNRLAALMGNLAGKDASILPKPTAGDNLPSQSKEGGEKHEPIVAPKGSEMNLVPPSIINNKETLSETDSANKPLVSILTPLKTTKELSPVRSDKHVHFILPGTNSSPTFNQILLTQTSASIVTPIISTSVSNPSISTNAEKHAGFSVPHSPAESNLKSPIILKSTSSASVETLASSKDSAQQIAVGTTGSNGNLSFSFPPSLQTSKQDSVTLPKLAFDAPKTTSPQKLGGFKFDLKTPGATESASTALHKTLAPTLTFPNSTVNNASGTTSVSDTSSTFMFAKSNEPKKDGTFSFGAVSTVNSSTTSAPTLNFGGGILKSPSSNNISTEPKLSLLNSTSSAGFTFGSSGNVPKLGDANSGGKFTFETTKSVAGSLTIPASTLSNNSSQNTDGKSTYPSFSFTPSTTAATTSAVFAFGSNTAVTSSPGFGSKSTSDFGTQNTTLAPSSMFGNSGAAAASSGFGNIPATSASAFGNVTTSATVGFGSTSATSFGGIPAMSVENSGAAAASSGFGNIPATSASVFGNVTTSSTVGFGSTSATSFGGIPAMSISNFSNTPNTSKSVFGTTPVTTTAIFGSTPASTSAFGTTAISSPSVFGNANSATGSGFGNVPTTTSAVFGTNNSTFGSNLANTTPMFGLPNSKTPTFGSSNTNTPAFGSSNTNTPAFGSSNTSAPGFGSSSVFGSTNTQAGTFGSNTAPAFGNSTTPKPVFGSSTATANAPAAFGSNAFGGSTNSAATTTSAPAFGASNPNSTFTFGSNKPTANVFGSATTTSSNTFGSNTFSSTGGFSSTSGFGSNPPAFGSSTTPANTFGATSAPTFGQVENKPAFTFGGSGENKTNPVFGSGAGNSAFGKPTNTQSGFGNSTGGFGSGTSGFSSQSNGGFNFGSNVASSSPAPFAFGASSGNADPPKPTFNFTGGSANPPTFGATSSTPAFGSANPSFGTPTFGATGQPTAGVFNIGAGTNTGRPRTLRAKRRT